LNHWKDRLGIIASVTCAIHCAATPILLAFLPALTFTEWMASPQFHQIAAIVCVAMVSLAIWPAFMKFRDYRVLSLSTGGLGLLISAAFFMPNECCTHCVVNTTTADPHAGHNHSGHNHTTHETASASHPDTVLASVASPELIALIQPWMTPLGGILLVVAHGLNLRRRVCLRGRCACNGHSTAERHESNDLFVVNTKVA